MAINDIIYILQKTEPLEPQCPSSNPDSVPIKLCDFGQIPSPSSCLLPTLYDGEIMVPTSKHK